MITANETVQDMIKSLKEKAKERGVSLIGMDEKNFNTFLDELFLDGGEARCIDFIDHADEYALQFGEMESPKFEEARWRVIARALKHFGDATRGASIDV